MKSFLHFIQDKNTVLIIYAALALLGIRFLSDPYSLGIPTLDNWINSGHSARLNSRLWWGGVNILFYLIIPLVFLSFYKGSLRRVGLQWSPKSSDKVYLYLFAFMLPLLVVASFAESFQLKYPFFTPAPEEGYWPWFAMWELVYCIQFLALEFFYRGLLLHSFVPKFGAAAILMPLIPYVMIHFSKPPAEAVASIVAGLTLGYLSYKKGSVIPGAMLHFAIALCMDLLALYQKGRL